MLFGLTKHGAILAERRRDVNPAVLAVSGRNGVTRRNLIHAIQGLHDHVKVLEEKTDVPAFPCVPKA